MVEPISNDEFRKPGESHEVRGTQSQSEYDVDANERDASGQAIQADGNQSKRASRTYSQKFSNKGAETDLGGMLRQLRKIREAHLAYVNSHTERLKMRLAEDDDHRQQVIEDMDRLETQLLEHLAEESEEANQPEADE